MRGGVKLACRGVVRANGHLDGQEPLHALAVEVALHADYQAHPPLRHLALMEVAGLLKALVLVLLLLLRKMPAMCETACMIKGRRFLLGG